MASETASNSEQVSPDGEARLGFWDVRKMLLQAVGGYTNLRILYSSSRYVRLLRKARREGVSVSEVDGCISSILSRPEIGRSVAFPSAEVARFIEAAEGDI